MDKCDILIIFYQANELSVLVVDVEIDRRHSSVKKQRLSGIL